MTRLWIDFDGRFPSFFLLLSFLCVPRVEVYRKAKKRKEERRQSSVGKIEVTERFVCVFQGPVGEVGGVRLPLQSLHGYGSVFMYSALTSPGGGSGQAGGGGGEVTLRLREPEDIPEEVLARLEDTATLSISLQGDAVLRLGAAAAGESLSLFEKFEKLESNRLLLPSIGVSGLGSHNK